MWETKTSYGELREVTKMILRNPTKYKNGTLKGKTQRTQLVLRIKAKGMLLIDYFSSRLLC